MQCGKTSFTPDGTIWYCLLDHGHDEPHLFDSKRSVCGFISTPEIKAERAAWNERQELIDLRDRWYAKAIERQIEINELTARIEKQNELIKRCLERIANDGDRAASERFQLLYDIGEYLGSIHPPRKPED